MDITEFSLILEHHRILAHLWISQNCRLLLNIIESLLIPKPAGSSTISRRRRIPELSSLKWSLYLTIEWCISRVHEDPDRRHSKSKKVVCCTSHSKGWLGLWWSFGPATLTYREATMGKTEEPTNNIFYFKILLGPEELAWYRWCNLGWTAVIPPLYYN